MKFTTTKQIERFFAQAVLLCLWGACLLPNAQATESDVKRPNFVFILVDDFGCNDLSCEGSKFYETPNIDRLAASGIWEIRVRIPKIMATK